MLSYLLHFVTKILNFAGLIYSTDHRILQEDTLRCLQLETQAQPQLNAQMHSLAQTPISTFTTGLCPPLLVIAIIICDTCLSIHYSELH